MAYPDGVLADDEDVLVHRHPHWKHLCGAAATFLAVTLVAGFLIGVIGAHVPDPYRAPATGAAVVAWGVLVCWRSLLPLLRWRNTHFVLTTRRVLVREGIVSHAGIDIPLTRVTDVRYRRSLSDRLLRTGTLVVGSAGETPLEFNDIPDVVDVHGLLYDEVFEPENAR